MVERLAGFATRHWRLVLLAAWLLAAAFHIVNRWALIDSFTLVDTDDNMRLAQVRALLSGQGWFDLRQYRLDPPAGANIHWSRLVDLPIATLMLAGRLVTSGANAEKFAIAVAPLLPYLLLGLSLALTARRLIHPLAYLPALAALFYAGMTSGMFMPNRLDHHGWQIALLALAVSALADPRRVRGGLVLGLASALSLTIGIEMILYIGLAGVSVTLFWVADREERERLRCYALALGGGTALGFVLFASADNRLAVCDALSPVWLSDMLVAGALLFGLSWAAVAGWRGRLALAIGAGCIAAAFHALAWSDCLSPLGGVSSELRRLWMDHVREVRPIYRHPWRTMAIYVALPATGTLGWALLARARRSEPEPLRRILAAAAPAITAFALMFWQTRAGPAAQMLAVPGAVAVGWLLAPLAWRHRLAPVRVLGTALAALAAMGALVPLIVNRIPPEPKSAAERKSDRVVRRCPTIDALRPVGLQPRGLVFTFNDLSPRLITVTHHYGVAGPYHRNAAAILDVQHAFRGNADEARAIILGRRADYVLICPGFAEATIYAAEAPNGFYAQLARGQVPPWLTPVPLPRGSPLRMWRVLPEGARQSSASG